ncbi:MAG: hypothetical protein QG626_753 [Patescibacteria group bacterium]|jgi:Tfp pilus assembly protein PilV|nr:hypothetical protein [Patescibacteria group bacterium]
MHKVPSQKLWQSEPQGFMLLEAMLATITFAIIGMALLGALVYAQQSFVRSGERVRAAFLAQEGLEAVRILRNADADALTDGVYGLALSGNVWTLTGAPDTQGIFTRTVTITTTGSDRKSVTTSITWSQNGRSEQSYALTSLLTRWNVPIEVPPPESPPL